MKKLKIKRIIVKTIILFIVVAAWNVLANSIQPLIANELALVQMQNSVDSSAWIQIYSTVYNYRWLLLVVFAVIIYYSDIKKFIDTFKEREV